MSPTYEAHIPMVVFVLGTARRVGLPYFTLARADYCPSLQAVELMFGQVVVELHGRNLGRVYELLTQHLAVEVCQATAPEAQLLGVTAEVVERVLIRPAGEVQ